MVRNCKNVYGRYKKKGEIIFMAIPVAVKCGVCEKDFNNVKGRPLVQVIVTKGYMPDRHMTVCKECEKKLAEMFHLEDQEMVLLILHTIK